MHVVVLGAGLLGVTTAYYLAEEGHQVTVIDRQPEPARETSFANAGLLTPGHASAWASPRAPMILLKSLWRKDTALRYRLKLDPRMWAWSLKFLANCTAEKNRRNTLVKLKLCIYSLEETDRLTKATDIAWERAPKGAIYLYRDRAHFRQGREHMKLLADHGVEMRTLEPDEIAGVEPALAGIKDRLAGAMHTPNDESGDARKFVVALAEVCRMKGVDEGNLVAFARLGSRLRFTATADFAGYDTDFEPADFAQMLKVARELFPNGGAYDKPDFWSCLRPMTPDGPPIMGASPIRNLWLNTGHGHMGWTMAAGSSRMVVDRILGRDPAIDDKPFALTRY